MKHYRLALFTTMFTLAIISLGIAQDPAIVDSLLTELSASEEDSLKVDILLDLGNQYRFNQPDTALGYFEQALLISEQLDSPTLVAYSKRMMGMVKESLGLYDQALEEFFAALAIYEEFGNKRGIASCYNDIAIIHYIQESFELCMEYLTLSFEIKKELGDKEGMSNYYTNMSALNSSLGRLEEALDFTEKSLVLNKELDDKIGIATAYGNIGTIQNKLGNYQNSLDNHLKSVEMQKEIDNKDGMAHSLSNVAGLYMLMADSVARTENQRRDYVSQAIDYGQRCYALTEELDAVYVQNYVSHTLHLAYKAQGNPGRALEYAEIFITTRDSIFNEEKTRAIEEMDTRYETEKKQQQIELQETQIEARDAKIKQQKTLRNALIVGLLAVLF
jgi:tetratricopeptide (TPR) repeat protein